MIIGLSIALFLFFVGCYFCGIGGTYVFINTLPVTEINGHVRNHPNLICWLFPVLVPFFCVIPEGYGKYYRGCLFMQTRNWITIALWGISAVVLILCGFYDIAIVIGLLYAAKWFYVSPEMELVASSLQGPFAIPQCYLIKKDFTHRPSFLSFRDWLLAVGFLVIAVVSFHESMFYVLFAALTATILLIVILLTKDYMFPGMERSLLRQILAVVNLVSVISCLVFVIFYLHTEKSGNIFGLSLLMPIIVIGYNRVVAYLIAKIVIYLKQCDAR